MSKKGLGAVPAVLIVVALVAVFAFAFSSGSFQLTDITGNIIDGGDEVPAGECNSQATDAPELRFSIQNQLNSSREYKSTTCYIYSGNSIESGNYLGSLAGLSTGLQAEAGGKACECYQDYTIVCPASSTVNSLKFDMTCAKNDNTKAVQIADHAGLLFKVYDESNKGYVYASAEATAGGWAASGTTFYSTTSNATDYVLATDAFYIYTIYTETNSTAATDTRFNDQEWLVGVNSDDTADLDEPSTLKVDGASILGSKMDCPTRIANDGYDWCYKGTGDLGKTQTEVKIEQHANDNVNPADDTTLAFATSGWFLNNANSGSSMNYFQDDSSKTYVHTAQTLTLAFS